MEIIPLELPGRGNRIEEPLLYTMDEIVEYSFKNLQKIYQHNFSYALFGHSMGTIIIYELIKKIYQYNLIPPIHVFISGRYTPNHSELEYISELNNNDFKKKIISYGGIPPEIFQDDDIFDFFLPQIRADYTAIENYKFTSSSPWNINTSVFYGENDSDTKHYDYNEWQNFTKRKIKFYKFKGDHFFINSEYKEIIKTIKTIIYYSFDI